MTTTIDKTIDEIIQEILSEYFKKKTAEYGAFLESTYGFNQWSGERLVARMRELRPVYGLISNLEVYNQISESDRALLDEYNLIKEYLDTPQGQAKEKAYIDKLKEDFKPSPVLSNKLVKVRKTFKATRTFCPRLGSVGRVVDQTLVVEKRFDFLNVYTMIWVNFPYPVVTDTDLILDSKSFQELDERTRIALGNQYGVRHIWSAKEGEKGLRVGFLADEIEIVEGDNLPDDES